LSKYQENHNKLLEEKRLMKNEAPLLKAVRLIGNGAFGKKV
jgi:hypothetical protein